jgi:hypothetical protein
MTDERFEKALFEAFLKAGKSMGNRAKGMSCFLRNWKTANSEEQQEAA